MAVALSANQVTFATTLAQQTGLNLQVVEAWMRNEQPEELTNPASSGLYNFLNVGVTPNGNYGTNDPAWNNPISAAKLTAAWLQGKQAVPGFGSASAGIQAIATTAGQDPSAQITAIQTSGWASGGESALRDLYSEITGTPVQVVTGASSPSAPATPTAAASSSPSSTSSTTNGLPSALDVDPGFWGKLGLTVALLGAGSLLVFLGLKGPEHVEQGAKIAEVAG
jgi:hypothetical protein